MRINIAIDGYSSCGKSTMARELARELGYTFIDSGAMYRAITLYFLRHKVALDDDAAVAAALSNIQLRFERTPGQEQSHICLNGEDVSEEIREMHVAGQVSAVAAIPAVRHFAVAQQQEIGKERGVVMDGRDIGTVVFPDAALKIFVTADIQVRVQRRYEELWAKEPGITLEEVRANLEARDHIDTTRAESPLRQAADAVLLDNSKLSREQQLMLVLSWAREKTGIQ
ncbi:MAG: (d)CMP kinase [Chitinophagaceae bacterium]